MCRRPMKSFVYPRGGLKRRLSISFSGGKTSAYMTKMLLDHCEVHEPDIEIIVTFVNTGQEHEETLKFVDRCDREFGFNVVWLEAVIDPRPGVGPRYKIVDFATANRDGKPYEDYIKKHGLPNREYKQCNSRLKTEPMEAFRRRHLKWKKGTYSVAVGIRNDEMDRVSLKAMREEGVFYPCIDADVRKHDVREWWALQSFNLNIPEHWGNCIWCWKKSNRKLLTIAKNNPEFFSFPLRMEQEHAFTSAARKDGEEPRERRMFRGNKTAADLLILSKDPFVEFTDDHFIPFDDELDVGGACGDSCEIFADED